MIKRALISVSDKTGLLPFAEFLVANGVELLSTGGTSQLLRDHNIAVKDVSDITGFPEMMDGRVKTLHPVVHGGLLARREEKSHRQAAEKHGIGMIDLLVVNLYPFETTLNKTRDLETLIENIDIGGPAMIRSAAKNHESVTVLVDVGDFTAVMDAMKANKNAVPFAMRQQLAAKAFARTAAYDSLIAATLSQLQPQAEDTSATSWPAYLLDAKRGQPLRYGENPHQSAALYQRLDARGGIANAKQLQGKELSYNNLADSDAAWNIVNTLKLAGAVLIKHANPCGVAVSETGLADAFTKALASDPVSAFGGILAVNRPVDKTLVEAIGSLFLEVIIAPHFSEESLQLLAAKKNLRLLTAAPETHASVLSHWHIQPISGGYLVQAQDKTTTPKAEWKQVAGAPIALDNIWDAVLAWNVVKYVKSNAIVLVKNGMTIGVGAGQMSRVDSVRIAIEKARAHGHDTTGATLASDAFFPFADNIELAAGAGIAMLVQPGGSMRDEEVIEAAKKHGMTMLLTGMRHFKH